MMDHDDDDADRRVRHIAEVLGVPVQRFYDLQSVQGLDDTAECLRLWYRLKTAASRATALDALRTIAAAEGG